MLVTEKNGMYKVLQGQSGNDPQDNFLPAGAARRTKSERSYCFRQMGTDIYAHLKRVHGLARSQVPELDLPIRGR